MKIQLLRHATTIIEYHGKKILVDPVFADKGAREPIPTKKKGKGIRNPIIDLPISKSELSQILKSINAVLITHTHSDHFDDFKGEHIPKETRIICQPEDERKLLEIGYMNVTPINDKMEFEGISITRTKCQHGGIYWKRKMGIGSGFIFNAETEKTLYITGDTIWCKYVKKALGENNPEVLLIYGGAAQFPFGRSITMNKRDILQTVQASHASDIIVVHMEAINHCMLSRGELRDYANKNLKEIKLYIPENGEQIEL